MRWQRTADAAQKRWCDVTTSPDRFTDLGPIVVPVVLVGVDFPDAERASFFDAAQVNAAAGQFPTAIFAATVGDVQLDAVYAQRIDGTNPTRLDWSFGTSTIAAPRTPQSSGNPSGSNGFLEVTSPALGGAEVLRELNSVPLWLPVAGVILEQGRSLFMREVTGGGTTVNFGVRWRNVG